jgi:uncharacterized membrane protein
LYEHGDEGDLVLTSFETGNALPAWAPLRVVIGHGPESVGMPEIEAEVEALYQFDARSAILAWLQDHRVRFVYYGPLERALREEKTQLFDDLEPAYQSQGYEIYDLANGGEKRTE